MSKFSIALSEILDAMKAERNETQTGFAKRIDMPLSTLSGYVIDRSTPNAAAIEKLTSGMSQGHALLLVEAYLSDSLPPEWRDRVTLSGQPMADTDRLAFFDKLPMGFRRRVELFVEEATRNEHIKGIIEEMVALMGLEKDPKARASQLELSSNSEKTTIGARAAKSTDQCSSSAPANSGPQMPHMKVSRAPVITASTTGQPSGSTKKDAPASSQGLNEDSPSYGTGSRKPGKPRKKK